jgi:hypothetical protein
MKSVSMHTLKLTNSVPFVYAANEDQGGPRHKVLQRDGPRLKGGCWPNKVRDGPRATSRRGRGFERGESRSLKAGLGDEGAES